VLDGPFAETKELVAGYTIIQVKSREEALEWARRFPNPHDQDGEIEIRPLFELGGLRTRRGHRAVPRDGRRSTEVNAIKANTAAQ
jgi:hypothetical protein